MSYIVCIYDFIEKKSKTLGAMTKDAAHNSAIDFIVKYIARQQGESITTKIEDLYLEPNLQRSHGQSRFFVKKSDHKYSICEKEKQYGWIYNSFGIAKHINVYIFQDKLVKKTNNLTRNYDAVIRELKNKNS